jgi:hypothetical protein
MDTILVKIFATALALSEVMTEPQSVKTHFDPVADRNQVVEILHAGCAHLKQAFDIESVNIDDLIATALDDPKGAGADVKAFHGLNFNDLNAAYHQFCNSESENLANPVVDLDQVIEFFNGAAAELPDPMQLKDKKLPGMSTVLDNKNQTYAEVFEPGNRRIWVPLADIPDEVKKAFIAAEDRRFFQHHGVLIRTAIPTAPKNASIMCLVACRRMAPSAQNRRRRHLPMSLSSLIFLAARRSRTGLRA